MSMAFSNKISRNTGTHMIVVGPRHKKPIVHHPGVEANRKRIKYATEERNFKAGELLSEFRNSGIAKFKDFLALRNTPPT